MSRYVLLVDIAPGLEIVGVPPDGFTGRPYTFQFGAVNGTAPYVWSVAGDPPPIGWTLSDSGVLSHSSPSVIETFAIAVRLRDRDFVEVVSEFKVSVVAPYASEFEL